MQEIAYDEFGNVLTDSTPTSSRSPPQLALPEKVEPEIQLKQYVGNGSTITCYIVNKGGPMKEQKLRVPQGVTAQISPPTALLGGQSGWIRFSTNNGITIDSIKFMTGFKNKVGTVKKKRFRCIPVEKKLMKMRV